MIWWLILALSPVAGPVTGGLFYAAERIDNGVQRLRAWRRWFAETDEAQLDHLVEVLHEAVEHEAMPMPLSPRLHERETELHSQSKPIPLPAAKPAATSSTLAVRAEVDASGCNVPCTARHCAEHAGVLGTVAQRRFSRAQEQWDSIAAWHTPTAEWSVSLLGLTVPDFPEVRSPIYLEAAT